MPGEQTTLPLEGLELTFVCPFCKMPLPGWDPQSESWIHCDPRPPSLGWECARSLAQKQPYERE